MEIEGCPFCEHGPMPNDYLMPAVRLDGSTSMHRTHRYCILVDVCGQETADITWGNRPKPGEVGEGNRP